MTDLIDRQAAIDALDVLCHEHRYRIPGKRETYSQYNEAWQDALDRAEGAIGNLPSAQPVWIPLAVKYPETNEDVLLQFPSNQGVGFYENGSWGINTGDGIYSAIGDGEEMPMAWMPLPKPWEGEKP